jgi:large subunit ribosomal protein L22
MRRAFCQGPEIRRGQRLAESNIDENTLYVKEIFVDQGPSLKRWRGPGPGKSGGDQKENVTYHRVVDER